MTTNDDKIAKEGYPFIGIAFLMALAGFRFSIFFGLALTALFVFVVSFFRNPSRKIPAGEGIIVVPADGTILSVREGEMLEGNDTTRVSIFMSPLNVHVNRSPVAGMVEKVVYKKGLFLKAYDENASIQNEQNLVVVRTAHGDQIGFVQIAGWLARRIICYAKEGETLGKGQIYGLIRFGSRMDVYLPKSFQVCVTVGGKVKAGETILAQKTGTV
ncbi:MAG: phosphatidylserine decarboxylase [Deltaproteobacteria bacterium RIFCSPLOWO2_12_FULL_40_28]|nr:MAG: phosphatidylserine decarboxylase [Deltaproteobacteria bacterium RIFCSPHIGHO2_02_FULL_40_28]OGQ18954.1 MAG: phosphatidylserine decarboxylase [Deltaproteobacteria bacterium RIFCSPHIGHO2_12_FULL_40_32]OGQ39497.1 MAG: phosphatidylserine decarboxylase [Deltaproteobacteria bacterium RIFCSPLOWO2_02_FULL_40_36]OGQ53387.1 MAG: phosphatidylserine decarboxylase [Deltaproteobacteria bacterium RIFCSPLOWO2_12_FULL_40_28]